MGCERKPSELEISSDDTATPSSPQGENAALSSTGIHNEERKEKQIEDYPQPLAVVGVSVL